MANAVWIWDASVMQPCGLLLHLNAVKSFQWSPVESKLAVCCANGYARIAGGGRKEGPAFFGFLASRASEPLELTDRMRFRMRCRRVYMWTKEGSLCVDVPAVSFQVTSLGTFVRRGLL